MKRGILITATSCADCKLNGYDVPDWFCRLTARIVDPYIDSKTFHPDCPMHPLPDEGKNGGRG